MCNCCQYRFVNLLGKYWKNQSGQFLHEIMIFFGKLPDKNVIQPVEYSKYGSKLLCLNAQCICILHIISILFQNASICFFSATRKLWLNSPLHNWAVFKKGKHYCIEQWHRICLLFTINKHTDDHFNPFPIISFLPFMRWVFLLFPFAVVLCCLFCWVDLKRNSSLIFHLLNSMDKWLCYGAPFFRWADTQKKMHMNRMQWSVASNF